MEKPRAARPKTRRKNCDHCVVIKRRCDRRTPVCSLCAEKKVPCTWVKSKASVASLEGPVVTNPESPVSATGSTLGLALESSHTDFYFGNLPFDSLVNQDSSSDGPF